MSSLSPPEKKKNVCVHIYIYTHIHRHIRTYDKELIAHNYIINWGDINFDLLPPYKNRSDWIQWIKKKIKKSFYELLFGVCYYLPLWNTYMFFSTRIKTRSILTWRGKKILDRYWSYSDQWLITIFLFWHIEKHLNIKQKVWELYSIISVQHQAEEKENKKINLKRVF